MAVTGATGFLGSHVLRLLRHSGASVCAIVDRNRGDSRNVLGDVETIWFDQPGELVDAIRRASPDRVIHLHASITTARDAAALENTIETNLLPSIRLMVACREMGVKRLILMGSGEEFALVTGRFDDASNANPPSPYGASKAAITCYAKMFWNAFQMPVVVLRPSVVYGPGQAPRMLIPQVMHALAQGKPIPVTGGMQTRDFIYVEDVALAILAALTKENVTGRSWNLGTGEVVTVKDCLTRIEQITGKTGLIQYGALPYKPGEVFMYEPVVEETFTALHWRPQISLDYGLHQTWNAFVQCSNPSDPPA